MGIRLIIASVALALLLTLSGCGAGGGDGSSSSGGGGEGSASLSWDPPIARMDGSVLLPSEIAGYKVYYGTSSGVYTLQRDVDMSACSTRCSTTITGLGSGTYYFAVTVTDTSMIESGYSAEVSKTIV